MILKSVLVLFMIVFISCEKDENEDTNKIIGSYEHKIEGCVNNTIYEINCVDLLEFTDSENVSILIGGGDIMYQTKYSIHNSEIILEKTPGLNFKISFLIQSNNNLKRLEDNEEWIKIE